MPLPKDISRVISFGDVHCEWASVVAHLIPRSVEVIVILPRGTNVSEESAASEPTACSGDKCTLNVNRAESIQCSILQEVPALTEQDLTIFDSDNPPPSPMAGYGLVMTSDAYPGTPTWIHRSVFGAKMVILGRLGSVSTVLPRIKGPLVGREILIGDSNLLSQTSIIIYNKTQRLCQNNIDRVAGHYLAGATEAGEMYRCLLGEIDQAKLITLCHKF